MFAVKESYNAPNILSMSELIAVIHAHKRQGETVGMCTGSFDLMHPGHVAHLNSAKKLCDVLIVLVASDAYNAKSRNTPGRPVLSSAVRAFMVSQLRAVNYVVVGEDAFAIFQAGADFYIRGPDYESCTTPSFLDEKEKIEHLGGSLLLTDDEKLSTTELIRYIKENVG